MEPLEISGAISCEDKRIEKENTYFKKKFAKNEKMNIISNNFFSHVIILCLILLSLSLSVSDAFETYFGWERCNSNWIINDIKGLSSDLEYKVFGQPFVINDFLSTLGYFLKNDNPSKPFVASFHGSPGTGKTMVSQIIAANLFFKGTKSKFYRHYTMADVQFLNEIELINDIKTRAKNCERSLFVFDEIEKMPDGTFEALKPFLDFHHDVGGIDFRKSIFIFISNNGMKEINSITKDLWEAGVKRENFKLSSFDKSLLEIACGSKGALKGTRVVKNYLVDLYLPFLPLEKEHVEQCIRAFQHDISPENVRNVLEEIIFEPKHTPIFSLSGCKLVESIVLRYHRHVEL